MVCNEQDEFAIDIVARLRAMRIQEATQYSVSNYLTDDWQERLQCARGFVAETTPPSPTAPAPSTHVPASSSVSFSAGASVWAWRQDVSEWCYSIVDHFDFDREVVSVAMSYLDRFLPKRTFDRHTSRAAAVTALYLAIKLFVPGMSFAPQNRRILILLLDSSGGCFSAKDIAAMEYLMLRALDWHVHPPTPLAFCREFMQLLSEKITPIVHHEISELVEFMAELSVVDYWFVAKRPSSVALAAIINALEIEGFWIQEGPGEVDPKHVVKILNLCIGASMDITHNDEISECRKRLLCHYKMSRGEEGSHVVGSPTGAVEGPNFTKDASVPPAAPGQAQEMDVGDAPYVAATCDVSPDAVILETFLTFSQEEDHILYMEHPSKEGKDEFQ